MADIDFFMAEIEAGVNTPCMITNEVLAEEVFEEVKAVYPDAVLLKMKSNHCQYIAVNEKSKIKLRKTLQKKQIRCKYRVSKLQEEIAEIDVLLGQIWGKQ